MFPQTNSKAHHHQAVQCAYGNSRTFSQAICPTHLSLKIQCRGVGWIGVVGSESRLVGSERYRWQPCRLPDHPDHPDHPDRPYRNPNETLKQPPETPKTIRTILTGSLKKPKRKKTHPDHPEHRNHVLMMSIQDRP